MFEAFFGFKKMPFSDSPDAKQLFPSQASNQIKARLQFLVDHHGTGLLTGEVGAGKSTAAWPGCRINPLFPRRLSGGGKTTVIRIMRHPVLAVPHLKLLSSCIVIRLRQSAAG